MKIKTINNYYNDENTYIVYDEDTKNGAVIDPGYKSEGILKAAEDDGVNIKYILLTHCHYDHISDVKQLKEKTGALIVSGDICSINISKPEINLSVSGLGYKLVIEKSDIILKDNEKLKLDSINIQCIYTPGHTTCGICYLINNENLFSGDTLFLRSVGRSDLPTGDSLVLTKSITERLYTLPENIKVYTGHGDSTSIGYEKKYNLFVKG